MILLFIDMLGVRARWHIGGRESAERAFSRFRSIIIEAIQTRNRGRILHGGIEADSAAIVCSSAKTAVDIGRNAFRIAFRSARSPNDERLWLRGVIVPGDEADPLRTERPLAADLEQIKVAEYSTSLLEAISAEKSGIKGMRLLIGGGLSRKEIRSAYGLPIHGEYFCPILRPQTLSYPGRLKGRYSDILWMASAREDKWKDMQRTMFYRLKWSAASAEELIHAAATQVMFNHWEGVFESRRQEGSGKTPNKSLDASGD
jgi:hypothetical protein